MLTLNQIVSQITNLATAHNQIAESGVGDFAEWQAKERTYPILWVFHESTAVSQMEIAFSIRLICADRVIVGEEGDDTQGHEQEVLSDTLLVLLDFLAYFQQNHNQPYNVVTSATIDPFTERLNDRLAGNSVTIQIRQPFDWNKCQIPQTGASIPPTVDGLTLYNFCDPAVIARLTDAQITCLESAICEAPLPCADATVTVNSTPFGTAPSGGSLDIPILNSAGVEVGSKVGTDYKIADSQISYNGSFVDAIAAEQALLLIGRLDGVQGGTYNPATNTIDFTTPVPPIHPITTAYLTAVGIANDATVYFLTTFQQRTGAQLWQMFNTYILSGVSDGWLTGLDTFYFPRWGSATANKWNVMNPIDTDAAFRMIFNGGWSHTPAGAKGNASTTWGNTKYDFVAQGVNIRNFTVAQYTNDEGSVGIDSGVDSPNGFYFASYNSTTNDSRFYPFNVNSNRITTNPMGLLIGVSSAATVDLVRNGVTLNSFANVSVAFKAGEDYMGALNRGGVSFHTNKRYAGRWTWRRALTAAEILSFNRATQILMTDMGIQA